jgi:hypothetical protein
LKEAGFRLQVFKKQDAEVARPRSMYDAEVAVSKMQGGELPGYKKQDSVRRFEEA